MRFVIVAALLAGCFDPAPVAGGPCSDEGRCPSGLTCVGGVCVEEEASGVCADLPDGTACGSVAMSECDGADTCVAGRCVTNARDGACYDCAAGAGLCDRCTGGTCSDAACTLTAGSPAPGELRSPIVSNNGDEGNMFDVVATTTLTITSFETHASESASTDYEIYTKAGTHVGAEAAAGMWTRVGGATFTLWGLNAFSPIPIPVDITIPAGERRAFYVTNKARNNRYHNGTAVGAVLAQTPELTVFEGVGVNYGMTGFGGTNAPRAWEGKIHYRSGGGQTLATSLAGAVAASGVMFDVTAKRPLEVTHLAAHLAPGTHDVELYFKRGSHAGAETMMMQWASAGTLQGVVSAGTNMATQLRLATPVFVDDTTAFYIRASGMLRVSTASAGTAAMNSDLVIANGVAVSGVFGGVTGGANPNTLLGYGTCD